MLQHEMNILTEEIKMTETRFLLAYWLFISRTDYFDEEIKMTKTRFLPAYWLFKPKICV